MKKVILFFFVIVIIVLGVNIKKHINNDKFESSNSRTIEKNQDETAPIIKLDNEKIVIAKGNDFKANVNAIDDIDGDLTDKIIVEGEVDTSTIGIYNLKYIVSDSCGNKSEKVQTVEVRNAIEKGLPVLMYHFFYSKDDPNYAGKTPDNNLIMIENFSEQMAYLKEENFYFPTWKEVEEYIDGKINLPEKSVVITDDDGNHTFFTLAVPVIEQYQIPVTSFVITDWYEERLDEKYEFVNYQSHSDDMHKSGKDGRGAMVNFEYDEIVEDLTKSKNKIETHTGNNCTIFCYPFGHYNDISKRALNNTGYNLAFTIEGGRVMPKSDKLALPRVRINGNTTMSQFKKAVN